MSEALEKETYEELLNRESPRYNAPDITEIYKPRSKP
jgi:hypothetical protein